MELSELNEQERIALVAVMRLCGPADPEAAEAVAEHGQRLIEAFDAVEVEFANQRADAIVDAAGLRAALAEVRPAARDVFFAFVREMVLEGGVVGREIQILELIEKEWGLTEEPARG